MKRHALIGLCLYGAGVLHAQPDCTVTHYSVEDGLSENTVSCMYQDSRGYLFIGTFNGLNRFDGYRFRHYKTLTTSGAGQELEEDRIEEIREDRDGLLWVRVWGGRVYRFDVWNERFTKVPLPGKTGVNGVLPFRNGDVWLTTGNEGCFRVETGPADSAFRVETVRTPVLPSDTVYGVHEDRRGDGWLLTGAGAVRYRSENGGYACFRGDSSAFLTLAEGENVLLLGTASGRVYRYEAQGEAFAPLPFRFRSPVVQIERLDSTRFVILTEEEGFVLYDSRTGVRESHDRRNHPLLLAGKLRHVYVDRCGELWLRPETPGILHYDPRTGEMRHLYLPMDNAGAKRPAAEIFEDNNGFLWLRQEGGGFCFYDRRKRRPVYFHNDPDDPRRLFTNIVRRYYSDRQGNLWLSTHSKGVEKVNFHSSAFRLTRFSPDPGALTENESGALFCDRNGDLWCAARDGSLRIRNREGRWLGRMGRNGRLNEREPLNEVVFAMVQDTSGAVWLGTRYNGLMRLVPRPGGTHEYRVERFRHREDDPYSLSSDAVFSLFRDTLGRIWAGTWGGGLNRAERDAEGRFRFIHAGNRLQNYPAERFRRIRAIVSDGRGRLWAASPDGVLVFREDSGRPEELVFRPLCHVPGDTASLSTNNVQSLFRSSQGDIWIGTLGGGVNRATVAEEGGKDGGTGYALKKYNSLTGFPSDLIWAFEEDSAGCVWMATGHGLIRFRPDTETWEQYRDDRLGDKDFTAGIACRDSTGNLLFGCDEGVVEFRPEAVRKSDFVPPLYFSRFLLFNREVRPGDGSGILHESVAVAPRITLTHRQSVFTLEFTALDYRNPKKIRYACRLEGFEPQWNDRGTNRTVTYTNLPPGRYLFRVRSTNGDGVWCDNERTLPIVVLPPFGQSVAGRLLWALAILIVISVTFYILFTLYRLRNRIRMEREMTGLKLKFFTDISHEIRTPLTLIHAPVEHLLETESLPPAAAEQLHTVRRNTLRLLRLVNQLLDFRKIQLGGMKLKLEPVVPGRFVGQVREGFLAAARRQGVRLEFADGVSPETVLWADRDKLEMIVSNLLSNALKFTPSGKTVYVSLTEGRDTVTLTVRDEGIGIPRSRLNRLFTPFYSTSAGKGGLQRGTGIGLALTKELCGMLGADIRLESLPGRGTTFRVVFRKGREHFDPADERLTFADRTEEGAGEEDVSLAVKPPGAEPEKQDAEILVAEDNVELREYLCGLLGRHYRIRSAADGREALEVAGRSLPDLIVSDILMPGTDGIAFVRALKGDFRTSHIPVVILTALGGEDDRKRAFEAGADDYLTKPFGGAFLLLRIAALLEQRKRLQRYYSASLTDLGARTEDRVPGVTPEDNRWLGRLTEYLEARLTETDIRIGDLCEATCISHSLLYKKLKSLTGLSLVEFIREFRLQQAARLIAAGGHSLKEVAYRVGFGDPGYFARCFRQKYGVSPSRYREELRRREKPEAESGTGAEP